MLEPLRALLPATGSWLTLASVLQQSLPFASTYLPHSVSDEAIIREQRVRMGSYLEALAGRLREADVDRVDFNVTVDNNPARSLLEFSEAEAVDLIALSTWGRGGASPDSSLVAWQTSSSGAPRCLFLPAGGSYPSVALRPPCCVSQRGASSPRTAPGRRSRSSSSAGL